MPANPLNAKEFLLSTDFPLDKVVFLTSGSYVVPSPVAGNKLTIPHGLPFIPLVSGSWDVTPSFSTNYDYYTGTIPSSNPATPFNLELDITADATNIYINPINVTGSPQTVYYRIFALEPSDSQANLPSTVASADSFILNTDYNYTKLYLDGVITGIGFPSTFTVTHGLGYPPQVLAWQTDPFNGLKPAEQASMVAGSPNDTAVVVDNSNVTFLIGAASNVTRIDYRIYIDDSAV